MTPIQQLMLGVGAKEKTYIDDVFNTYVYKGNGSGQSINNGLDLSGKGGMTWLKERDGSFSHRINDTVRGSNKQLYSNLTNSQATETNELTSFNSNGFSIGASASINDSSNTYASWSFRKAKGFFDVVTFNTGNPRSTNQRVSHSLGCVPGMIFIKRVDSSNSWLVHHTALGKEDYLTLDSTAAFTDGGGDTYVDPTATDFGYNAHLATGNDADMVAYVFAGGDPVGYGSVSMTSDSSGTAGNRLKTGKHSDFAFGTDPFTIECWFKWGGVTNTYNTLLSTRTSHTNNDGSGWSWLLDGDNINMYAGGSTGWVFTNEDIDAKDGNWHHVAVVREGTGTNQTKLYHNGTLKQSATVDGNFTNDILGIGDTTTTQHEPFWGHISNVRTVKNQALYTSGFTPSTTPLTTTSQSATAGKVGIVGCNDVKIEKFTKSSGGLFAYGNAAGSTTSPFTTPANHNASRIFGEDGDQDIIKCGSYIGNGSTTGPEINLGFEPQWLIIKRTNAVKNWYMLDNMRGITAEGDNDDLLYPNLSDAESGTGQQFDLTATGFNLKNSGNALNGDGDKYAYIAIRRPDGYVGKPVELGTDVFAMDTGASSSTIPNFDSGFPVDFAFDRAVGSVANWDVGTRLTQGRYLNGNTTDAEGAWAPNSFDSNVGWNHNGADSGSQSWMWKRHAGFDVVTYKGDGSWGRHIRHSLGKAPEMMWVKNREDSGEEWIVYHKGLDGGNQPETHNLYLHNTDAELDTNAAWNDEAPTSTHFTLGGGNAVNKSNKQNVAILFASVDGISKVGSYTGNGSSTERTITTGFQPRFLIIKRAGDTTGYWQVYDTLRGWGSGNDAEMYLNDTDGQNSSNNRGAPASTGFTLTTDVAGINASGGTYIYYAHA